MNPPDGLAVALLDGTYEIGHLGVLGVDVEPRRERLLARPGEHDHPGRMAPELLRRPGEGAPHLLVKRVMPLGAVQGDNRETVLNLQSHGGLLHGSPQWSELARLEADGLRTKEPAQNPAPVFGGRFRPICCVICTELVFDVGAALDCRLRTLCFLASIPASTPSVLGLMGDGDLNHPTRPTCPLGGVSRLSLWSAP